MNYSLHRLDSKYTSNCISIAYNFRLQCSEWYALTCLVHVNKFMPKSVNSVRRKKCWKKYNIEQKLSKIRYGLRCMYTNTRRGSDYLLK